MRWILMTFILSIFGCGDDLDDSDMSGYQRLECQKNIATLNGIKVHESFAIIPNRLPTEIYALICFDKYYEPMMPTETASNSNRQKDEFISNSQPNTGFVCTGYPEVFSYNGSDTLIMCTATSVEDPMRYPVVYYKDLK